MFTTIKNYFFGSSEPAVPPVAPAPAVSSVHPTVLHSDTKLARLLRKIITEAEPHNPHPVKVNSEESNKIGINFIRDSLWAGLSKARLNAALQKTNDFWSQTGGQMLYCSLATSVGALVLPLLFSRLHNESYKKSFIYALIAAFSVSYSMVGWNYFALLGQEFFLSLGYDEDLATYLAAFFPGPGLIEGWMQNIATTLLEYYFVKGFKFNPVLFALNFAPLNFITGDLWLVLYKALGDVVNEDNIGELIGLGLFVGGSVAIGNYGTYKVNIALGRWIDHCLGRDHTHSAPAPTTDGSTSQGHFKFKTTLFSWHKSENPHFFPAPALAPKSPV